MRHAESVIHPSAMPRGSVLYVSQVAINGRGPRFSAVFTISLLRHGRLPACTR